ncbi:DUF5985 family protein [Bradyrhizobium sp. HKCCYLS2058]|uniref:DUF5985 family protein n=1 Tax=Bradyrhizobium TaxID=374 RepID=UPI0029164CBD|nr:DUF5985 family protein [Bradyrhizobium sp. SZCCHNR1015]
MAAVIYTLCALTCALCTGLLARAYVRFRSRLLLWSAISFLGLTFNNIALWVDKIILPEADLSPVRNAIALIAMLVLIYGLVWESE